MTTQQITVLRKDWYVESPNARHPGVYHIECKRCQHGYSWPKGKEWTVSNTLALLNHVAGHRRSDSATAEDSSVAKTR